MVIELWINFETKQEWLMTGASGSGQTQREMGFVFICYYPSGERPHLFIHPKDRLRVNNFWAERSE